MREFVRKNDWSEEAVRKAYAVYMGPKALDGTIARHNDGIELILTGDYNRDYNYERP